MAARERGEEVVTAPEDETPLVLLGVAGPRTLDARRRARVREDTASPLLIRPRSVSTRSWPPSACGRR
jgi:hypothetical protein